MSFPRLAGLAGIGFVVILILANLILTAAGFPTPSQAVSVEEVAAVFTAESGRLRLASALLPTAWLLATVFATGVAVHLGRPREGRIDPWWIVGLAGVLMQSVVFTSVEATRLALMSAGPDGVAGIWALHNALFGFNQVFLATALIGFSMAGVRAAAVARWHAAIGFLAAALLFATATTSPYGIGDVNPLALAGLAGWLLWLLWILVFSARLIRDRVHGDH
ncbi:hypothetical protein [Actinoplanes xinjiangensis]|jgi:hypothetical protein|uniref:DUF4386 family protein n=1 Tax=Actinoplanes xinjiangensis TaxID=512350 RepID=A0A316EMB3_9ACTN|nr:hypothetical protein [Actinoplanes xinjiangensis]PWK33249.1 hypothetical protein BC793_12839 [Actinoplanes xinjiangensis]GIF43512.1 hypothetical protein Axi01nite_78230 [Actinoplanes xinjiangensis]